MFHIATEEEIKSGKTTDIYFDRTVRILKSKGIIKRAKAEIRLKGFPQGWEWGILAGIEEIAELLKGLPVDVHCMDEGTVFNKYQPVFVIDGLYPDYCVYETALLGFLCQASGIATKAARCRKAADSKLLISFGARRMHPAITPMVERNAFIGGCDGVSAIKSAELLREDPSGTIPHALVLMLGDSAEAVKAFHEVIEPKVKRVCLVDTFCDEKFESIKAAEVMGDKLFGVRLDTPGSRRGDLLEICREVRWELDYRGYNNVKIIVSGGINENEIERLNDVVDGYGVGTAISGASTIDFSFDIMEIEGKPVAKRGKKSGSKQVYRCKSCFKYTVAPLHEKIGKCSCSGENEALLKPLIKDGEVVRNLPKPQDIRKYVLEQIGKISIALCIIAILSIFTSPYSKAQDDESIEKGKEAYIKFCSVCHGETGIGDGEGAVISGISPRDLTDKAYMSLLSDDEIVKIIRYGEDAFPYLQMPGQGRKISESTALNIVYYLRTTAVDRGPLKGPSPQERAKKFEEPIERGRIYYLRYCSPCHGVSGDGKGWAAKGLMSKPAVLSDPVLMSKFTEEDILSHVKGLKKKKDRKMPIFGKSITNEIVKVIASYVKTLSVVSDGK